MPHAFLSSRDFLLAHLGHCTKCMRMSLLAAIAAWTVSMAAYETAPSAIAALAIGAAILLSALWVTHLIVFAWKKTISSFPTTEDAKRTSRIPSLSRREFVPNFLRTLALAAVMTASPRTITSAFAQNQGPCDQCSRFRGTNTCWTCCSCQNSNCIAGCKNASGGNPDKYNTCIGNCSTIFGNCNKGCQ